MLNVLAPGSEASSAQGKALAVMKLGEQELGLCAEHFKLIYIPRIVHMDLCIQITDIQLGLNRLRDWDG